MKTGDEVRFLNARGGGIVKGFQGKDIVLVEDETGFELPVLINECVVIGSDNKEQVRQTVKSATVVESKKTVEPEDIYEIVETHNGNQISLYIAYLANDRKSLSNTTFECYLVNDSNYFLMYNYMGKENLNWVSRSRGIIEPNTKMFIEEFESEDLNNIERVCLQYLAYKKDKPFDIKLPVSQELRIDTTKFYKLHAFKENDFFDEEAILYTVIEKDVVKESIATSIKELAETIQTKDTPRARKQHIERKEKNKIIEVDLHAHEILDSTTGLSNSDILEYQLKIFKEALEEYKKKKGQKLVFIHGKGEGVLKNAIITELKKNNFTTYQDASFQEYGFGATMVIIK